MSKLGKNEFWAVWDVTYDRPASSTYLDRKEVEKTMDWIQTDKEGRIIRDDIINLEVVKVRVERVK